MSDTLPSGRGGLALILHAHLPFVRHPEHERFLEEDWLYEAITETYLPLLRLLTGWQRDGIEGVLTLSLTPTLGSMLHEPLLQERYVRHVQRLAEFAERETRRTAARPAFQRLARHYLQVFTQSRREFEDLYHRDLVDAFRRFQEAGHLEIIAGPATHALLPLLQDQPAAVRAQIQIGCDWYRAAFGVAPRGIWLPECAYCPMLDQYLQEADIRWFTVDTHGLLLGRPAPRYGAFRPVYTPAGVAAFGRDPATSRQVWSATEGYPGHPDYREFYRDAGFDLDTAALGALAHPAGFRSFSGVKYHRVTGGTGPKRPYHRDRALARVRAHARHFLGARRRQSATLQRLLPDSGLVVAPYDAELFGHWWYEGPEFLDAVVRGLARGRTGPQLTTPTAYLRRYPRQQICQPAPSSWGDGGYWQVWLGERNAWMQPALQATTRRLVAMASACTHPTPLLRRTLNQAAREVLLAQASDWPFLVRAGTATAYATARFQAHLDHANRLLQQVDPGPVDERALAELEWRDNLFPWLDYRVFA